MSLVKTTRSLALVVVCLWLAPLVQAQDIDLGLVAHWPLDGDFLDTSGFDRHGTPAGDPQFVADRHGEPGGAVDFNGTTDWVTFNGTGTLHLFDGMTVCAWANVTAEAGVDLIMGKHKNSEARGFYLAVYGDKFQYYVNHHDDWIASPGSYTFGQWRHVAGTYDGETDTMILYIDGVEVATGSSDYVNHDDTVDLTLAATSDGAEFFRGKIDDPRVYDRPLTPAEIAILAEVKPVAAFTAVPTCGDAPLEVVFTDESTGMIDTWDWSFGDGGTAGVPSLTYLYTEGGIYEASLVVSSSVAADTASITITVYGEASVILAVDDVPADQGGWVYVQFLRSQYDTNGLQRSEMYSIQRLDAGKWVTIASAGAYGEDIYNVLAPTQCDSVVCSSWLTNFRVIAHMDEGNWAGVEATGWSLDNIAPAAPASGQSHIFYGGTPNQLEWAATVDDEDLDYYRIYRSDTEDFATCELLAEVATTAFEDAEGGEFYYRVAAVDAAGNESDPTTLVTLATVGVEPTELPTMCLHGNHPNPFNPHTTISFSLPSSQAVSLVVYGLDGRLVARLVSEILPAGEHGVVWDGCNDAGQQQASGTYLYRLQTARDNQVRRMTLLK
ncbi:MAG: LamG-like jellyroll fold domain-containing protein [bacterium]